MSKTEQQQPPTIEQTSPSTNTEANNKEGLEGLEEDKEFVEGLEEDEECESGESPEDDVQSSDNGNEVIGDDGVV